MTPGTDELITENLRFMEKYVMLPPRNSSETHRAGHGHDASRLNSVRKLTENDELAHSAEASHQCAVHPSFQALDAGLKQNGVFIAMLWLAAGPRLLGLSCCMSMTDDVFRFLYAVLLGLLFRRAAMYLTAHKKMLDVYNATTTSVHDKCLALTIAGASATSSTGDYWSSSLLIQGVHFLADIALIKRRVLKNASSVGSTAAHAIGDLRVNVALTANPDPKRNDGSTLDGSTAQHDNIAWNKHRSTSHRKTGSSHQSLAHSRRLGQHRRNHTARKTAIHDITLANGTGDSFASTRFAEAAAHWITFCSHDMVLALHAFKIPRVLIRKVSYRQIVRCIKIWTLVQVAAYAPAVMAIPPVATNTTMVHDNILSCITWTFGAAALGLALSYSIVQKLAPDEVGFRLRIGVFVSWFVSCMVFVIAVLWRCGLLRPSALLIIAILVSSAPCYIALSPDRATASDAILAFGTWAIFIALLTGRIFLKLCGWLMIRFASVLAALTPPLYRVLAAIPEPDGAHQA